jgi:hypothetical protein
VEGALVGGLVVIETVGLDEFGAIAQPIVLGHALHKYGFGSGLGAVFAFEIDHQPVVFFGVLPWEEEKGDAFIGEAVARVVAGRGRFAGFGFWDQWRVQVRKEKANPS